MRLRQGASDRSFQIIHNARKAAQACLETAGVKRKGRLTLLHPNGFGCQYRPGVHRVRHQVPGHAVIALALEQGPDRRVEPRSGG